MLRRDPSSSSEQDFASIITKLKDHYKAEDQQKQSSINASSLEFLDRRNYQSCQVSDLVSAAEFDQYYYHPANVLNAASICQIRLYFGTFPEINLCYCVVDDKLFYWKKGDTVAKMFRAKGRYISSVIINSPDEEVFYSKNVKCVLAISTDTTICVIPIKINSSLFNNEKNTIEDFLDLQSIISTDSHTFVCSALCPTGSGYIFAGSDTGAVFLLKYKVNKANVNNRKIKAYILPNNPLKMKAFNYFLHYLPTQFFERNCIVQLCFEKTRGYLAALDRTYRLRFFTVTHDFVVNEIEGLIGEQFQPIVKLVDVPASESGNIVFIGITKSGDRLSFAQGINIIDNSFYIMLVSKRQMVESQGQSKMNECLDGVSTLNSTVVINKGKLCLVSSLSSIQDITQRPEELFNISTAPETCLSVSSASHILESLEINAFKDAFGWQHIEKAPKIELVTTKRVITIKFNRPVDILSNYIRESNGNYTPKIFNWMKANKQEAGATALLLASEDSSQKLQALFVLSQFAKNEIKMRDDFNQSLHVSSQAFLLRVARILEPAWFSPLFEIKIKKADGQTTTKYKISSLFDDYTTEFIVKQLTNVNELITEYNRILVTLKNDIKKDDKNDNQNENAFLYELSSYVHILIEVFTFIEIVGKQNKTFITNAINLLDESFKNRLISKELGEESTDGSPQVSIVDALRELCLQMFASGGKAKLGHELRRRCPTFFTLEDSQLLTALAELNRCLPNSPTLERIVETILKLVNRAVNLDYVCQKLIELKHFKGVVDICLARAAAIDPSQKALLWFKGQRLKTDEAGTYAFDKRYQCYEHIFQLINEQKAFDIMITTNDELFHLCLYQRIFQLHKQEQLLSRNTPFIEEYLQEFAPTYMWSYKANHREYSQAANELYKMAMSDKIEATLQKRIDYLQDVAKYAIADNMSSMLNEVQVRQQLALIQKSLSERTGKTMDKLLDNQTLLNECTSSGQWDLVLKLIAACPVQTNQREQLISQVWTNMLVEQLWNTSLHQASTIIVETMNGRSNAGNDVLIPKIVVPVLEEYKMNRRGECLWAEDTIIKCGAKPNDVFQAYYSILERSNLTNQVRADYTYAAIKLANLGAKVTEKQVLNLRKWISEVGKGLPFFNDALNLLASIPNII
ncbi:hypothetical protein TVAG_430450 [Trichomonas vaginalis G3]|uniref:Uncharacterized protein n=1 Tax=Trichomonas vaginalis (strain ATCC PRA-98 / G3) TaxID=412133 RepID=A2E371_TRIV3|nr:nuclear pore complex protein NUP155 family [Trichomonas vaginalis G3]EAY12881.1 hypothetical protein TVAG_430450 [Trichomonas vaginalis G3]KAI5491950.1 nuclear pore complex protein NUP155 family [Trichomonas vaginalis G3]|eukprot:XP_001325104.1 hypothetical protein [Trichomonas vaginalis G3]